MSRKTRTKGSKSDGFYRAFEDKYRGSRDLIRSRLNVYLPFIESLKKIDQKPNAVDLGCGRGEWLELLKDAGFEAQGVDLDDGMLAACRELGLQVKTGDALAFIRELPDASQTIVSGFHIAEHLSFSDLRTLVEETFRILKPAGLLILETPNPENLRVGATTFYSDPTHKNPLPPHLLSFLPEYYGYARTKILRLQESPELVKSSNASLGDVLTGVSPDYAVIAQKPADSASMAATGGAFEAEYGITLDALAKRFDQRLVHQANESAQMIQGLANTITLTDGFAKAASAWEQISASFTAELASKNTVIAQRESKIGDLEGDVVHLNEEAERLRQAIKERDEQVNHLEDERLHLNEKEHHLRQAIKERNEQVSHLEDERSHLNEEANRLRQVLKVRDEQASYVKAEMSRLNEEADHLRQAIKEQNEQTTYVKGEMSRLNEEADRLRKTMNECEVAFEEGRSQLHEAMINEVAARNDALVARATELAALNQHVAALRYRLAAVEDSTSWRITEPLRFVGRMARCLARALIWVRGGVWAWLTFRPDSRPHRIVSQIGHFIARRSRSRNSSPVTLQDVMPVTTQDFTQVTPQINDPATSQNISDLELLTPRAREILVELKAAISLQHK